jgi:hypothetical protein
MRKALRSLALTLVAGLLAFTGLAVAAQPLKSKTYKGETAHAKLPVTLTVSANGKTIKASVPNAPLYCEGGGGPVKQVTKPATISKEGSFKGSIGYVFNGKTAYKVTFSGRFVKPKKATGTVRSEYSTKSCSGSTTFSASTK